MSHAISLVYEILNYVLMYIYSVQKVSVHFSLIKCQYTFHSYSLRQRMSVGGNGLSWVTGSSLPTQLTSLPCCYFIFWSLLLLTWLICLNKMKWHGFCWKFTTHQGRTHVTVKVAEGTQRRESCCSVRWGENLCSFIPWPTFSMYSFEYLCKRILISGYCMGFLSLETYVHWRAK